MHLVIPLLTIQVDYIESACKRALLYNTTSCHYIGGHYRKSPLIPINASILSMVSEMEGFPVMMTFMVSP